MEEVERRWLALEPDRKIVAECAREWNMRRRSVRRYVELVKARNKVGPANELERRRAVAARNLLLVEANLQRQMATEARAKDDGNFKAEVSSQRAQLFALELINGMHDIASAATPTVNVNLPAHDRPGDNAEALARLLGKTPDEVRAMMKAAAVAPEDD